MQTPGHGEEQDNAELQAPPELVSALKRLPPAPPFVPPAVDEAVLRAAARHLGERRGERAQAGKGHAEGSWRRLLQFMPWVAAAAAVMGVFLVYEIQTAGPEATLGMHRARRIAKAPELAMESADSATIPAPAPAGLNPIRRLDILDALKLARRLKSGPVRDNRWDINQDGEVDERDVRAIANQVVQLDKRGHS